MSLDDTTPEQVEQCNARFDRGPTPMSPRYVTEP